MNARTSNRISATSPQPPHTCHHVSRLHHTCHTPHWPGRGPRMLTGANEEKKGPKRRVWRRLGRFVGSSPRQPAARHPPDPSLGWTRPTKAHEGRQEPTKRNKGPNDARRVIWALGASFFKINFSVLLTTMAPNDASGVVWVVS